MERDSIHAVERLTEKEVPFHEAAAHLLVTLDGNDSDALDKDAEKLGETSYAFHVKGLELPA